MLENNQPLFLTEQEFLICHNLILLRTYKNKKSLDLTVKATLSISTLHQAVVSVLRPQLTAQRIVSSAISFRLPPDSISAAASSGSPLPSSFLSGFSGPDFHTTYRRYPVSFLTPAVFAFFRPLQFWVLTTQPLFLLFPLLPVSASQWLPQCSALAFAPSVPPVLSCLVSRAFFPGFGTWLRCMFPFTLPRFAPTAVPRVLAFFSGSLRPLLFQHFPLPFRFLSSASAFLPATQPSASSFPFFRLLPHSGIFRAASPLSLPCFPRSSQPGFPCSLSRFPYSAFCWFPFVLPCFAPAAVPQVIPFQISPPGPVPDFRFSFVRFRFSISLLSLCFFLSFSSDLSLTVASTVPASALASAVSPFSPA